MVKRVKGEVMSLPRILTDSDGDEYCSECLQYIRISGMEVKDGHAPRCSSRARNVTPDTEPDGLPKMMFREVK